MESQTVAFTIQTHPARADLANALAAAIGGDVSLSVDPAPDAKRSPWRTYRHALERAPACSHLAVIQDDGIVCQHFRQAVEMVAAARPDRIIALFVPGRLRLHTLAIDRAAAESSPWAELPLQGWVPAIGLVWPHEQLQPFLAWSDEQGFPDGFRADDEIIYRYLRHLGTPALATVPSLVEHPDDVPSLIGMKHRCGKDRGRVAHRFIGGADPRTIIW